MHPRRFCSVRLSVKSEVGVAGRMNRELTIAAGSSVKLAHLTSSSYLSLMLFSRRANRRARARSGLTCTKTESNGTGEEKSDVLQTCFCTYFARRGRGRTKYSSRRKAVKSCARIKTDEQKTKVAVIEHACTCESNTIYFLKWLTLGCLASAWKKGNSLGLSKTSREAARITRQASSSVS